MCFAYKSDVSFTGGQFYAYNITLGYFDWFYGNYKFIGDSVWHYDCVDISKTINLQVGDTFVQGVSIIMGFDF